MSRAELHHVHAARQLRAAWLPPAGLLLLALAGCYTYRPLPAAAPAAGLRVQAALTDAGADSLAGRIGRDVLVLAGDVVSADSTGLTLAVREVENRRGERSDWEGEPVVIPRRYLRDLQERHLSLGGTGLLGGAVAAGLFAATEALGGRGTAEGGGAGPGGGQAR